ncbi:CSC1-like protein [Striga hermonthica]|uniref:CSC1-like protein n=1 Tax=Striga hermonthica TaxID=68872 RepID=A0A9N7MPD1_STRHE|nr:CSC1-like protein [Striga hermonthica]
MATLGDIGVSALINILSAFAFLLAFALLRIQPINDRVYFPKWYMAGKRTSPRGWGGVVGKFVNLNVMTYFTFLNWMPQALKMSEPEIISHAGLDSAVFLRIYTLGLKIFGPIAIAALLFLIPVNVSDGTLFFLRHDLVVSDIDKLSISNVRPKSYKFFVHISMEYLFTFWACFLLYKEYGRVASMRLNFLSSQGRCAEQFTVLVRNVPHVSGRSVSDSVETFFQRNHPDHYLCHQAVYNANKFAKLVNKRNRLQNWLDYNQLKFERHPDKRPTRKATFFITYIMVDGWAGIAGEILRLKPLVIFHLKNMFIVKTERDLEKAMNPGGVSFPETLPSLQLYFLLGIVYMVVTPILLPFILVFFALAYFVYRHQVINVYDQQYESAAAFWPHVHGRIIASLLISQLLLMGLLSTKEAANSTPLLVVLPILTLAFHKYCKSRFEPAFRKYPLEEAMSKDTQDRALESEVDLKSYLADAYLHPIFHSFEEVDLIEVKVEKNEDHVASSSPSKPSSPSPQHTDHDENEPAQTVQHYEVEPPQAMYHYEFESYDNVYRYDTGSQYQYYHY